MKKHRLALVYVLAGVLAGVILCLGIQTLYAQFDKGSKQTNEWNVGEKICPNQTAIPPFTLEKDAVAIVTCLSAQDDYSAIVALNDDLAVQAGEKVFFRYIWWQDIPEDVSLQLLFDSIALNESTAASTPICYYLVDTDYTVLYKTMEFTALSKYVAETFSK